VAVVGAFLAFDDAAATGGVHARLLAALLVLVAVGSFASVRVRLQSAVVAVAWTDAAVLVCVVSLPPAWVPLTVAIGVLTAKLFSRISPFKAVYNAAKASLSATAGVIVAMHLGVANVDDPLSRPWQVLLVSLAVGASEHLIGVPVLALASKARWKQVLCLNGDIKILLFLGQTAVALLTLWLRDIDTRLLAVVPPVALSLHLMYAGRVSARSDLAAWKRLSETTEELNDTNLDTVLAAAVTNAAKLFSAEQAEVFLRDWPQELIARPIGGRSLPVVAALRGLSRLAAPQTLALVEAVAAVNDPAFDFGAHLVGLVESGAVASIIRGRMS